MKLYHGTSIDNAKKIMKEGFKSRLITKNDNWKGKFRSHDGFVYLTRAYPIYYAMHSANVASKFSLDKDELASILLVEVNPKDLYPDDDFLRQALKTNSDRINLEKYKQHGLLSLRGIGNVAIKPDKIKKVIGCKNFKINEMARYSDPSMSITNYQILGNYYKELTDKWWNDKDWKSLTIDKALKNGLNK